MDNTKYQPNQSDQSNQLVQPDLISLTDKEKEMYDSYQKISEIINLNKLANTSLISMTSLLNTDFYQITMSYAYWKNNKHMQQSVFVVYFRKAPFDGQYVVSAGIDLIVNTLKFVKFTDFDIDAIRDIFTKKNIIIKEEFYDYLKNMDFNDVSIRSVNHGEIVFPNEPLVSIEGPLLKCQLLETLILGLISYPCLVATNARRMVYFSQNVKCLEYGLRRAQGIDAGNIASKYAQIGGFSGTSNVMEGYLNDISISGTIAHSFVSSFNSLDDVKDNEILKNILSNQYVLFKKIVLEIRQELNYNNTNDGELASFISYALTYPNNFFGLVDTYDTLTSGIKNYICVALALHRCGYNSMGIRVDSGDLGYLSNEIKKLFISVDKIYKSRSINK